MVLKISHAESTGINKLIFYFYLSLLNVTVLEIYLENDIAFILNINFQEIKKNIDIFI